MGEEWSVSGRNERQAHKEMTDNIAVLDHHFFAHAPDMYVDACEFL